jgi:hypothetical protein
MVEPTNYERALTVGEASQLLPKGVTLMEAANLIRGGADIGGTLGDLSQEDQHRVAEWFVLHMDVDTPEGWANVLTLIAARKGS